MSIAEKEEANKCSTNSDLLNRFKDWADGQVNDDPSKPRLSTIEQHELFEELSEIEGHPKVQELAQAVIEGRAYQALKSGKKYPKWVHYSYDLPMQDRMIILSATAEQEGFVNTLENPLKTVLPKVSFENVRFQHVPWPKQENGNKVTRLGSELSQLKNRTAIFQRIDETLGEVGSDTLIVCPAPFYEDVKKQYPLAMVTYYGRDVGSNEYRDCTRVLLLNSFYVPNHVHVTAGLSKKGIPTPTDDDLKPYDNTMSAETKLSKDMHFGRHSKQMIARGACRKIDDDNKAGAMEVFCMIEPDHYYLLPDLFPKALFSDVETSSKDTQLSIAGRYKTFMTRADKARYTLNEIGEAIGVKAPRNNLDALEQVETPGYKIVRGQRGRRPTEVVRVAK